VKRFAREPRPDWRARVEAQGLVFHTAAKTGVYWGEDAYYEFSPREIDAIEHATRAVHALCLRAVDHVIANRRFAELGIEGLAIELVERSWRERAPALYGRLDLAFGPDGVPKLLEYNADTPTSLLEAAVVQWTWCSEQMPGADQATALHDELIARWRELAPIVGPRVHFASVEDLEDEMTVAYLRDTAQQAGLDTTFIAMSQLGWDPAQRALVDLEGRRIASIFKLYPWEGLVLDTLAPMLRELDVHWLEPAWKMILSNKAILPILWELFPDHPNLLAASREAGAVGDAWVKKPLFGREGSNVTIAAPGVEVATEGPYDDRGWVYQAYADLGEHDGMRPVIGSWLVGDRPAGIGIRETPGYVTDNTARFVPHVVT
jgi:glutathionylspermidine synthase